jgi:hypothetical protein
MNSGRCSTDVRRAARGAVGPLAVRFDYAVAVKTFDPRRRGWRVFGRLLRSPCAGDSLEFLRGPRDQDGGAGHEPLRWGIDRADNPAPDHRILYQRRSNQHADRGRRAEDQSRPRCIVCRLLSPLVPVPGCLLEASLRLRRARPPFVGFRAPRQ